MAALLGLALVISCDGPGPVAPDETRPDLAAHRSEHTNSPGTFELRGFEDCVGELVIVTGTIQTREHIVTSTATGNQDHTRLSFLLKGTGIGQETGTVYKYREVSRFQFNTPNLAAPHGTFTDHLIIHLIGPGANVKLKIALHVTINGQGLVKVVVDQDRRPCQI